MVRMLYYRQNEPRAARSHFGTGIHLFALAWFHFLAAGCNGSATSKQTASERSAPVAVGSVLRQRITQRTVFSGSLEPRTAFTVTTRVGGQIRRVALDLGDPVPSGGTLVTLDDAEYRQALAQADAELAVAAAVLTKARSALAAAARDLGRVQTLRQRKVISEAEADAARLEHRAREAEVAVALAEVTKASANRQTARIRLGYTEILATAPPSDTGAWVVAERFVEPGDTVAANTPLLRVIALNPLIAVIFVTERDYRFLAAEQTATFSTDAYPNERFTGRVERIAPVFRQGSRQAQVELVVANPDTRLKPGMFVQVEVALQTLENAVTVPVAALTTRNDRTGVFVVNDKGDRVKWREVQVRVREGKRVAVSGEGVEGRVVTLGQHLLIDETKIVIPEAHRPPQAEAAP